MLDEIEGVLNVDEVAAVVVCNNVPPVSAEYQRKFPLELLLALKESVPGPQSEAPLTVGGAGAVPEFTKPRTRVLPLEHPPAFSNSTQ